MSALCRKRHVVNFRFREIQFATVHITFITLNTQSGVEGLIGQEKRQEKGTGYFFLRRCPCWAFRAPPIPRIPRGQVAGHAYHL
jgi:hypothetical protein